MFRLLDISLHNIVRYPMVWEQSICLSRYVLVWCPGNRLNDERIFTENWILLFSVWFLIQETGLGIRGKKKGKSYCVPF